MRFLNKITTLYKWEFSMKCENYKEAQYLQGQFGSTE